MENGEAPRAPADICTGLGDRREPSPRAGWYLLALAVFTMFFNLWGREIENKDYVRYAEVAREIVEGGDWLVLRYGGEYYPDKPPLHFWKMAGAYRLFGVNAGAARVPSAAFAVLGAMLAWFYGVRVLRSRAAGLLAALMLLGSFGWFWWGRRTRIDMEFGVLVSAALVCFHLGWESGGARRRWWYAGFWGATGLAFLDKAWIALSGCAVVAAWIAVNAARKTPGLRARFGPGAFFATQPVALVPVAPWALGLWLHPEFAAYREAFRARHIMNSHEWLLFYLHALPTYLLPWSPLILFGLWQCLRLRREPARLRGLGFALTWAGTMFFMLNLTSVKDHRYLLLLYVPCAIVGAWAAAQLAERHRALCARAVVWADRMCGAAAAIACAAAVGTALRHGHAVAASLGTAAVLLAAFLAFRRWAPLPFVRLCASVVIVLHAFEAIDVPRNEKACPRLRMANALRARGLSGETIAVVVPALELVGDPEELKRITQARLRSERLRVELSFYFNRLVARGEDLPALARDPRVKAIIVEKGAADRVRADPALSARGGVAALDGGESEMVLFLKTDA
ncbi:MAG TPA: hypothetical protein DCM87_14360 [Planctomycetes bacterium]|nr:hypothetical protein [Planctomycetota bacterium]